MWILFSIYLELIKVSWFSILMWFKFLEEILSNSVENESHINNISCKSEWIFYMISNFRSTLPFWFSSSSELIPSSISHANQQWQRSIYNSKPIPPKYGLRKNGPVWTEAKHSRQNRILSSQFQRLLSIIGTDEDNCRTPSGNSFVLMNYEWIIETGAYRDAHYGLCTTTYEFENNCGSFSH